MPCPMVTEGDRLELLTHYRVQQEHVHECLFRIVAHLRA